MSRFYNLYKHALSMFLYEYFKFSCIFKIFPTFYILVPTTVPYLPEKKSIPKTIFPSPHPPALETWCNIAIFKCW